MAATGGSAGSGAPAGTGSPNPLEDILQFGSIRSGRPTETIRVRPPEEVIELQADDAGRVRDVGTKRQNQKDGTPEEPKMRKHSLAAGLKKFKRSGPDHKFKVKNSKKLSSTLNKSRKREETAILNLIKSEVLQTTEAGYVKKPSKGRLQKVTQSDILESAGIGVAQKRFSLELPYGPYTCSYTRNGQHLVVGGRRGQVAMLHCETMQLTAELQLKETIRAVQTLHNQSMFAVAQKKYIYLYDTAGTELHCLKDCKYHTHLDFLHYHYLLVSGGENSELHYRDISTGQGVATMKTKLGPVRSMRQNPRTAVMHVGHSNGVVTLWSPSVKEPLVKMWCQAGHVSSLAVYGNYMVTSGTESVWKVWDLRKYECLHGFKCVGHAATALDISMTGLVALGYGSHLQIWKDAFTGNQPKRPFMVEEYPGKPLNGVCFQPYEDVCMIGHSAGFGSILVPGAGVANFDSFEANPFETKKQRREKEVHSLLEKLQPDSIMLDDTQLGNVNRKEVKKYKDAQKKKQEGEEQREVRQKKKMRGKNKAGKRMKKKHLKEAESQKEKARARIKGEKENNANDGSEDEDEDDEDDVDDEGEGENENAAARSGKRKKPKSKDGAALSRFYNKRRRKT